MHRILQLCAMNVIAKNCLVIKLSYQDSCVLPAYCYAINDGKHQKEKDLRRNLIMLSLVLNKTCFKWTHAAYAFLFPSHLNLLNAFFCCTLCAAGSFIQLKLIGKLSFYNRSPVVPLCRTKKLIVMATLCEDYKHP